MNENSHKYTASPETFHYHKRTKKIIEKKTIHFSMVPSFRIYNLANSGAASIEEFDKLNFLMGEDI